MDCNGVELSLLFTDDNTIRDLNYRYLGVDSATDVLAFPMDDVLLPGEDRLRVLGDVVISVPTAYKMAQEHNCPLEMVLDLLLAHGILHLVGYDHATPDEASLMDKKTKELLSSLGYPSSSWTWYYTKREEIDTQNEDGSRINGR